MPKGPEDWDAEVDGVVVAQMKSDSSLSLKVGWYKKIITTLEEYSLDTDFETIKNYPPNEWKYKVTKCVEEKNKERLSQKLHKTEDGQQTVKTNTAIIVEKILDPLYVRKPVPELLCH